MNEKNGEGMLWKHQYKLPGKKVNTMMREIKDDIEVQ